jgi:heat shock protein HtpX
MVGGSYWFSDKLALKSAKARIIEREDSPEFYDMVASLAQRANMPMPRVAVSPSEQPNAFATGRGPKNAVVCATTGLLQSMPRHEIEGVMAHELMHVKHRDILIGSVAAAIATAISFLAQMAMFASMFGGGRRRRGPAQPAGHVAHLAARPHRRQPDPDGHQPVAGVRGRPRRCRTARQRPSLADALERIEVLAARRPMAVAPAQAQAYIHNPLSELRGGRSNGMARLFSTHPATEERIARLRAM